ncbi:MAG: MBL fold metallo-hydrolase [Chitinophagaceae bacterium]
MQIRTPSTNSIAKYLFFFLAICTTSLIYGQTTVYTYKDIRVQPITHATFQLWYGGKYYLVDPSVETSKLDALAEPDYILYTDIHGDHFNPDNLKALKLKPTTVIIAPDAVQKLIAAQIPNKTSSVKVLANGTSLQLGSVKIDAIPMYNLTPERLKFHTKGRGNGYVLHLGKSNVYISGDTEDIPEMRALKNIDLAFLCMNLPYTMDIDQAASAALAFQPKVVIPYHYRGQNGLSDVHVFQQKVNAANPNIKVELLQWYPDN